MIKQIRRMVSEFELRSIGGGMGFGVGLSDCWHQMQTFAFGFTVRCRNGGDKRVPYRQLKPSLIGRMKVFSERPLMHHLITLKEFVNINSAALERFRDHHVQSYGKPRLSWEELNSEFEMFEIAESGLVPLAAIKLPRGKPMKGKFKVFIGLLRRRFVNRFIKKMEPMNTDQFIQLKHTCLQKVVDAYQGNWQAVDRQDRFDFIRWCAQEDEIKKWHTDKHFN